MKVSEKFYQCTRCGYIEKQNTNHYGNTWSYGRVNVCPKCPPHAKYGEFGGQTIWKCIQTNVYTFLEIIKSSTANIIDRHRALAAFYYAREKGFYDLAVKLYLEKRRGWLNWLTETQRQWQNKTKNKNKANHHDSIAIRESYVRCHDSWEDKHQAEKFIRKLDPWYKEAA